MEREEALARQFQVDAACMGFLSETLGRAILIGEADSEDASEDAQEIKDAETVCAKGAQQTSACEMLTVNAGSGAA